MRRDVEIILGWLSVIAYAGVISYLSAQSTLPVLPFPAFPGIDKVAHACGYGLFSVLLYWAVCTSAPTLATRTSAIIAGLITILYGIADEIHQHFVPMRIADPFDVLADGVGGTMALLVLRVYSVDAFSFSRRKQQSAPY